PISRYYTTGVCCVARFFFLVIRPPPRSTLFPYTTLFRSRRFSFFQAFAARLGGESLSFLTFAGPLLGEATKVALLRKRVPLLHGDRKSTRLNSSHVAISYAVFCLKKKTKNKQ